jgi:cytochrome d ubiquinol oxidase subunit I
MNITTLSQMQFAITSVYHFFFVPLTLGLSVLIAIMETMYVRKGEQVYKDMAQFWGKLFLINFAMGVVTGIVQEFQFGMNWSQYSRFVGDVFGAPLAIEALLAFFLESTFLGLWIFGWERLSKKLHLLTIWMVAIGSNFSALWILIANSFMQEPLGYTMVNGHPVMSDFGSLISNPHVWTQFPHTVLSGFTTAGFFVMGISVYHLLRKTYPDLYKQSFKLAAIFGTVSALLVAGVGHQQAQLMVRVQPMKMAAAEALWDSQDPASLSLLTITNEETREDAVSIRIPYALSILAYNKPEGRVEGINDLEADFIQKYGAGDYVPPVFVSYWSFRAMVGAGMLMILLGLIGCFLIWKKKTESTSKWMKVFLFAIALPYLANSTGWILTEVGRQPWVVYGLMKTADAVSPNLTPGMVLTTLIGFTLVYGGLIVADVYLLVKYAKAGPTGDGLKKLAEAKAD